MPTWLDSALTTQITSMICGTIVILSGASLAKHVANRSEFGHWTVIGGYIVALVIVFAGFNLFASGSFV